MKNTTIALIVIIGIIAIGTFFFMKGGIVTGNVATDNGLELNGETQEVVLGMRNYNYYPNTIKVKAGIPVSISLDSSAAGCSRYFTIPELRLSKNLATPSDTLVFTPQKGTYRFQCGMGMYYGTLIVE